MFGRKSTFVSAPPRRGPRDGFSETVIRVVETVGPAVIGVRRTSRSARSL